MKLVFLIALTVLAVGDLRAADPQVFRSRIDQMLEAPGLRHAIWGIRIEEADGQILYDRNSSTLLAPASNRKLFSAAFAAHCLGIDRQLATRILISGPVDRGRLLGDVIIVGDGDPSLGGRFDAERRDLFNPAIAALRARGIREIAGGVIADVSLFGDDRIPGSWKNDNLGEDYAAPVDAIAWNENVIGFRVEGTGSCMEPIVHVTSDPAFAPLDGSVICSEEERYVRYRADATNRLRVNAAVSPSAFPVVLRDLAAVEDPALYAAQALDDALRHAGVRVSRAPGYTRTPASGELIDTIQSPMVGVLLATVLEPSQNLYAEMLLKRAAAETREAPITYGKALAAEEDFFGEIGIDREQVRFLDGSGLSPDDLVTNRVLIAIMRWMSAPEREGFFRQVLARPGGEGTLRNRLTGYESRIAGKTGTINTVAALSGWADTVAGERRFFSIIVNHHTTSSREVREAIDAIARMAAGD